MLPLLPPKPMAEGSGGAVPPVGTGWGGPGPRCAEHAPPRRGAWELSVTRKESKIESMPVCS